MDKRTGRSRRETILPRDTSSKASPARKARKSPSPPPASKKKPASPVRKPKYKDDDDEAYSPPRVRQTRSRGRVIPPKPIEKEEESKKTTSKKEVKSESKDKRTPPSPRKNSPVVKRESTRIKTTASPKPISSSVADFLKPSPRAMKLEDSGDIEVSKLTYNIDNLTPEPSQHSNLTPSLTEKSERSNRSLSRSMSRSVFDDEENSDNDVDHKTTLEVKPAMPRSQLDFETWIEVFRGLLVIAPAPLLCLYLVYGCRSGTCSLIVPNLEVLKQSSTWFNLNATYVFLALHWGIGLISALPFGRFVRFPADRGFTDYVFNGLITEVIVFLGLCIAQFYFKYPVAGIIYKNYFQFAVVTIACATLSAIIYFIRATFITPQSQWNPSGNTGSRFLDLIIGREINPKLLKFFDVKLINWRQSIIFIIVLNSALILKNLKFAPFPEGEGVSLSAPEMALHLIHTVRYNPTALLASALLIIYATDILIYEHHYAASFELQYEGAGFAAIHRYAVFPFLLSILPKYLLDNKVHNLPTWALAIVAIIFIVGISLKRSSERLKYQFRLNPSSLKSTYIESLPTIYPKRILVSKLWRIVRRPNYMAEILTLFSLSLLLFKAFTLAPAIALTHLILVLIHRAIRTDRRSARKYQAAWARYTIRVPNLLVPKVL